MSRLFASSGDEGDSGTRDAAGQASARRQPEHPSMGKPVTSAIRRLTFSYWSIPEAGVDRR
ncbi:hypothetical protein [Solwaraspora sp. WMMA2065]|uniref:hypothetical protein n=1 Tax=Solwaraspora sp. WMMA2065 TaxID=3015166 RepID=UPI00259AFAD7|nr:hypothetical protein [Solwaraspora sp. WMMA2065]WJK34752.1 hypothetical protein O7610_29990 [Solwaraspora sp. WMMA2065]